MLYKNNEIKANTLRVISEDGDYLGVFSLAESLKMAKEQNLDLVQTNDNSEPVCKLIDYGKYLYSLKKKEKETKQKILEIKEIHIRLNTDVHDLEIKANKIKKFFSAGHKVKVVLSLKGRERNFQSIASETLEKFLNLVGPYQVDKELTENTNGLSIQLKKIKE